MEGLIANSRVSRVSKVVSPITYTEEVSKGHPTNLTNYANYTANRITISRVFFQNSHFTTFFTIILANSPPFPVEGGWIMNFFVPSLKSSLLIPFHIILQVKNGGEGLGAGLDIEISLFSCHSPPSYLK